MPKSPLIMIIRHAEKPTAELSGIHPTGKDDENALIVRGWQRAGALVRFFAPLTGPLPNPALATPTHLMAACRKSDGADPKERSLREEQTLTPLAELLGIHLDRHCGKGEEEQAARAAIASPGPVLIAWDHNKIPALAQALSDDPAIPAQWPSERFDLIFVLRLNPQTQRYEFSQVPQLLLAGDTAHLIHQA